MDFFNPRGGWSMYFTVHLLHALIAFCCLHNKTAGRKMMPTHMRGLITLCELWSFADEMKQHIEITIIKVWCDLTHTNYESSPQNQNLSSWKWPSFSLSVHSPWRIWRDGYWTSNTPPISKCRQKPRRSSCSWMTTRRGCRMAESNNSMRSRFLVNLRYSAKLR